MRVDGPAAVNQTAQGIWQLQIGCLLDCTGTQQLQQASQSNTTVQAPAGGSAVNGTTQLIWQLQIGCLFWCYDAVESQGASGGDSTTLVPPAPPSQPPLDPPASNDPGPGGAPAPAVPSAITTPTGNDAPVPVTPSGPAPPPPPVPTAGTGPSVTSGPRGSALGAGLVLEQPGRGHPAFEAVGVVAASMSATAGGREALVFVSAARSVALEYGRAVARRSRHRERQPSAARGTHEPRRTTGGIARRVAVDPSASSAPWLALALAVAAALGFSVGLRRLRGA